MTRHLLQTIPRNCEHPPFIHPEYFRAIGLSSSVQRRIQHILSRPRHAHETILPKSQLPDNARFASHTHLKAIRAQLILTLRELSEKNEGKPPIIIVCDDCFTNLLLKKRIAEILGDTNYEAYVKVVDIDYDDLQSATSALDAIHNNSLIILGGSFADAYTIDPRFYES